MKTKGKHWPYTIVGLLIFMIAACVVTVVQSLDFPVEDDYSYFDRYQNVENNFNQIQKLEEEFLANFEPVVIDAQLMELKNSTKKAYIVRDNLTIIIKQLSSANPGDIKLKAMFVRPHTAKKDSIIKLSVKDGTIIVPTKQLASGRWQLMIEYTYEQSALFKRLELFKQ